MNLEDAIKNIAPLLSQVPKPVSDFIFGALSSKSKNSHSGHGGDGGTIVICAMERMDFGEGTGLNVNGGDGTTGGKAGKVLLYSPEMNGLPDITAEGGKGTADAP